MFDKKIDVGFVEVWMEIVISVNCVSCELMFFIVFIGVVVGFMVNVEVIIVVFF